MTPTPTDGAALTPTATAAAAATPTAADEEAARRQQRRQRQREAARERQRQRVEEAAELSAVFRYLAAVHHLLDWTPGRLKVSRLPMSTRYPGDRSGDESGRGEVGRWGDG